MTQSTKDKDTSKTGYVQSLLSPPGVHPSAGSSRKKSVPDTSNKPSRMRKCSLIREESSETSICKEEFMEVEVEPRPVKSMENLLDIIDEPTSSTPILKVTSPSHDQPKRTLKSVCSSPQLLNQIFEENESDDEDDIVPSKFPTNAMFVKHSGIASPEILRKYEQRTKRRGAGQRGTSCSSSDASDNDEAEGRSRKDKLKHKFAHRRDSSDHSSDTDGPSGHGGNYGSGARFNGGGGSSGGGGSGPPNSQDKDDRNSNRKDNSGGKSKGHRQNHIGHNLDVNMKVLTNRLSQISAKSVSTHNGNCSHSPQNLNSQNTVSQSSFTSLASHYIGHTDTESMMEIQSRAFSDIGQEYEPVEKKSLCTDDCQLNGSLKSTNKILTDINSNGIQPTYCKPDLSQCIVVPSVESKCCSVV
ncbi:hypothetical protein LOTGIDRAFT_232148 [Lottia gigantea]|uniref:Uncharacterized protein n=1 Tax=Lottia gigantea TaxID=225164 RepID=V4ADS6_LOTGI|nr:hypothetical protein LOTGIDRAFT_232148 [Lottia gigantea]ESO95007.1 hypothetical protein LOTGIDRAFT_232148 [Lottia gigantea]